MGKPRGLDKDLVLSLAEAAVVGFEVVALGKITGQSNVYEPVCGSTMPARQSGVLAKMA